MADRSGWTSPTPSLLAALESGDCQFGIVSVLAEPNGSLTAAPGPHYFDVSAMGVGRHAQHPERALQFVNWLIVNHPLEEPLERDGKNVAIAGWGNEEARLLAERAGYH